MHWGQEIERLRTQAGKTVEECAAAAGLSVDNLLDVEGDATEFFYNISMGEARRLARAIGSDVNDLVRAWLDSPDYLPVPRPNPEFYERHAIVAASTPDLEATTRISDQVGWGIATIELCARTSDAFEANPIYFVVELAKAIGINPSRFIAGP